jgi:TrmH family RNA methyltransferase
MSLLGRRVWIMYAYALLSRASPISAWMLSAPSSSSLARISSGRLSHVHRTLLLSTTRLCATSSSNPTNLITSPQSNTIKRVRSLLRSRKKRLETGLTIVEGPRSVTDLVRGPKTCGLVKQILIAEQQWELYFPQLERILQEQSSLEDTPQILAVADDVLEDLADTVTPQGILSVVQIPQYTVTPRSDRAPLYLILDGLQDPGNLGTLLRSSLAVGVTAILLLPGTTDPWAPKALRSSMGCALQLPLVVCASWEEAADHLQSWDCQAIWAATMLDDVPGTSYSAVNWAAQPSALVIGAEGNGLSETVRRAIRDGGDIASVYVPMETTVESLNAGVCGSVILFEYQRQCLAQMDGEV